MTSSVDGLISGLSTSSLISQLMQVEASSQTSLKVKLSAAQKAISSYQSINSKMSAIQTAAQALTGADGFNSAKATSSSPSVTASAQSSAAAGSLTFTVQQLAQSQSGISTSGSTDLSADVWSSTDALSINGNAVTVTGTKLADVVNSINTADVGVRASAVQVSDGTYRLQLAATSSGQAGAFTVSGLSAALGGGFQNAVTAQDAVITVGSASGSTAPYSFSSSTNTFSQALPGASFTVSEVGASTTVTVANDPGGVADRIQTLVTAANAAVTEIGAQTAWDASTKTGAPLTGDYEIKSLADQISGAPSLASALGSSTAGLSVDRDGKITFDRQKFLDAYAADPASAQKTVTDFAQKLQDVAKTATDSTTGTITAAIDGRNSDIKDLGDQIASWDIRLATKRQALQLQFSNLEVALGKLKDQSSWLSGQIASLPTAG